MEKKRHLKNIKLKIVLIVKNSNIFCQGISLTPIKWGAQWTGASYNASISVYAYDGSVSLFHAGVEVGQGYINCFIF